jgi:hypothetical protein
MQHENIIRDISNIIRNFAKKYNLISNKSIGYYYQIIHYALVVLICIIVLFNNNPIHLVIVLIIVSLDAFSVVVLHNCPLTILEKKYLKSSLVKDRMNVFKKLRISYKCNHIYEQQLELLTNVWSAIACKILVILIMKTFNKNIIF